MVRRVMEKAEVDPIIIGFTASIAYIALLAFVVIAALGQLGIQTTSFIAILGAAGLAIGLALQGSLGNFAAGVLMIIFKPFKVGDFIEGAGVAGTVEDVDLVEAVIAEHRVDAAEDVAHLLGAHAPPGDPLGEQLGRLLQARVEPLLLDILHLDRHALVGGLVGDPAAHDPRAEHGRATDRTRPAAIAKACGLRASLATAVIRSLAEKGLVATRVKVYSQDGELESAAAVPKAHIMAIAIAPALQAGSLRNALLLGAFFGLVTYATYDLTNHATVKDWPWIVTVVDLCWGMLLSASVSCVGYLAGRWLE